MSILDELIKSAPSTIIDLFQMDLSMFKDAGGTPLGIAHFIDGRAEDLVGYDGVKWNGVIYASLPVTIEGISWEGGSAPSPKLTVANIAGVVTGLNLAHRDLLGAKVTRIRTMIKYLDGDNFQGGNADADPNSKFPDESYYIDRKSVETSSYVEYELVSVLDISSIKLPRRLILQNICTWKYRDENCNYTGTMYFTKNGVPTVVANDDKCGKRLSDCKLRFKDDVLNFGGFPGAGLFN